MAIVGSGEIKLRADIALEVDGNATGTNVSLRALSNEIGLASPDSMSEFYGWANSVPPTVTTNGYSRTNVSFYMTGTVNSDGGAAITERGFYFGTSSNRASNAKYVISGTTGGFNYNATGLSTNTTYYFWAYATNSSGTTYGAQNSGTTYPTLGYNWTSINQGNAQYFWHHKLTDYYGSGVTASTRDETYFGHPYLGTIYYSTATTQYTGDSTGGWGNAQDVVGRLNVAGYNSTHTIYTRTTYSPSSWKTPAPLSYGDPDVFIEFVHPNTTNLVSNNSVISAASWSHYTATGYNISSYITPTSTRYLHNGGYMSEANMYTQITVNGG